MQQADTLGYHLKSPSAAAGQSRFNGTRLAGVQALAQDHAESRGAQQQFSNENLQPELTCLVIDRGFQQS